MSRPRAHQLASVKRMLLRLSLLDGRLLSTREGLRLVRVRAVKDAAALVQAASEPEGLSPSSLARHLELEGTAVEPTERWLGAAQRDLRILAQAPALLRFIAESHRALGRFGRIDGAWLADRQSRLDALGAEVALRRQGADVAPQPRRLASLEAASSLVAAPARRGGRRPPRPLARAQPGVRPTRAGDGAAAPRLSQGSPPRRPGAVRRARRRPR